MPIGSSSSGTWRPARQKQDQGRGGLPAWLAARNTALADCRQADIDEWIITGPAAYQVRDFTTWAAEHGHCDRLTVPGPARSAELITRAIRRRTGDRGAICGARVFAPDPTIARGNLSIPAIGPGYRDSSADDAQSAARIDRSISFHVDTRNYAFLPSV